MNADFLDSNVFVYLLDEADAFKSLHARQLVRRALESGEGCISHQVVQETLHVVTRKLAVPASPGQAHRFLEEVLLPLWRIYPTPALCARALDVKTRYRFSFYDALIVAAALEGGCRRLLTEDLHHGQQIGDLTIVNPFLA